MLCTDLGHRTRNVMTISLPVISRLHLVSDKRQRKKEKINRELSQPCLSHLHHLLDLTRLVSRMFALIVHEDRDLAAAEQVPLAQYTMQSVRSRINRANSPFLLFVGFFIRNKYVYSRVMPRVIS